MGIHKIYQIYIVILTDMMGKLNRAISGSVARKHENDRAGPRSVIGETESQSQFAQGVHIEEY